MSLPRKSQTSCWKARTPGMQCLLLTSKTLSESFLLAQWLRNEIFHIQCLQPFLQPFVTLNSVEVTEAFSELFVHCTIYSSFHCIGSGRLKRSIKNKDSLPEHLYCFSEFAAGKRAFLWSLWSVKRVEKPADMKPETYWVCLHEVAKKPP